MNLKKKDLIFLCNSLNFLHYWYNPPFSSSFYSSFMVLISFFYVVSNCKKMVKLIFCSVNFSGFYLVFFVPFTKEYLYQQYFLLHCTYKFVNYLSENVYFPVLAKALIYTLSQIFKKSEHYYHYSLFSIHFLQHWIIQP